MVNLLDQSINVQWFFVKKVEVGSCREKISRYLVNNNFHVRRTFHFLLLTSIYVRIFSIRILEHHMFTFSNSTGTFFKSENSFKVNIFI